MTPKQKAYKKILVQQIHTSKLYCNVYKHDRDLYELMLKNSYNVNSSKDLNIEELKNLLKFLNGKTARVEKVYASSNQIAFIKTLWEKNSENKDESSLLNLLYNRFKISLKHIENLEKKDFRKVIALLQNMKVRKRTYEEAYRHSMSKLYFKKG